MATADATDVSEGEVRPKAALPWEGRLLLTLVALALYYFGHRLKLPLVNTDNAASLGEAASFSLLNLGFTGLFSGFILVELFSVATSPGRRLRQGGAAGRDRLNRAALGTSLVIVAIQAVAIAIFLQTRHTPFGEQPIVANPGVSFMMILVASITASTIGVFVLANLLSEFGIGNGFALLNLVELGPALVGSFMAAAVGEEGGSPVVGLWMLGLAVLTFLLIRHVKRTEATHTAAFPQGILAVAWTGAILRPVIGLLPASLRSMAVTYCAVAVIAVVLLSWICFHLFSSRPRLETNVPEEPEVLNGLADLLRRRLPLATALLAGGIVAFTLWQWSRSGSVLATGGFLSFMIVLATGFDFVDQYRFMKRNGLTAPLVQLDNVHFSYRLVERLAEEGIDALARGHVLRSLYFFLGPLYKIDVLVPAEDLEDARGVLAELEVAREVKVF
jgi:preprotein translocase subunit SecY